MAKYDRVFNAVGDAVKSNGQKLLNEVDAAIAICEALTLELETVQTQKQESQTLIADADNESVETLTMAYTRIIACEDKASAIQSNWEESQTELASCKQRFDHWLTSFENIISQIQLVNQEIQANENLKSWYEGLLNGVKVNRPKLGPKLKAANDALSEAVYNMSQLKEDNHEQV